MNFTSSVKQTQQALKIDKKTDALKKEMANSTDYNQSTSTEDERKSSNAEQTDEHNFTVDYVQIEALMNAVGCDMADSKSVEHRLIPLRGAKQMGHNVSVMRAADKKARADWKKLIELSKSRKLTQSKKQSKCCIVSV